MATRYAKYGTKKYQYGETPNFSGGWGYFPEKVGSYWLEDTFDDKASYTTEYGGKAKWVSATDEGFILSTRAAGGREALIYSSLNAVLNAIASGKKGSGKKYKAPERAPLKRAYPKKRKKAAKKHFSMTAKQLCAVGDKSCRAELKRRGRDSSGKKLR
jgi:hypothetical protein